MIRMFFLMVKNSILRSSSQKFLTFLTIFLSVMLIACMLNITINIGNKVADELRGYGANIVVMPKSGELTMQIGDKDISPLKDEEYLKEGDLHTIKEIFWRNNIVAFAPFLTTSINLNNKKIELVGTYFHRDIGVKDEPDFKTGVADLYRYWQVDGEFPKDDSLDEILVGKRVLEELGLKVGDRVVIGKFNPTIVGSLTAGKEEDSQIYASLKLVQELTGKEGLIQRAQVSAMTIPENDLSMRARRDADSLNSIEYDTWYCSAYASSIAYQITQEYPLAVAKAVLSVSLAQSGITKKIQDLMGVVSLLVLTISAIGITSLMSSEIYKRKREIGLFKALGASSFAIYLQFIIETLSVGLVASIVGTIFGYLLSFAIGYKIFGSFMGVSIMVFFLSVAFGLLICIAGSIVPLKNVIKLLPAEVLYDRK